MFVVVFTFYVFAMKLQNSIKLQMRKLPIVKTTLLLGFVFAMFSFVWAQNTGNSLTNQLEIAKNAAITNLETTTTQFHNNNFSGSQSIQNNANYQSLACLWAIEQTQPGQSFADDVADLKSEILQNYLDLDQQIKKIWLWIPVDQNKLQSDITNFATLYNTRTNQLISSYTAKLEELKAEVAQYSQANASLLSDLNKKVVKLNNIDSQYKSLQDLVFQFNNLLLQQEGNMTDAISEQKTQAVATLEQRIDQFIGQQLSISSNILWLEERLKQRKRDVVRLYRLDFDDAMDEVVGNRYSPQAHDGLKEQIQTIRNTFYTNQNLRCENILTADMDIDGYARVVSASISDMNRRLAVGISALQATGSSAQIRQSMFRTFQWLYGDRIDEELTDMRKFSTQQLELLREKAVTQNEELTNLQEAKKEYDAMQNGTEKEQRKQLLISQARALYDQAASKTIKNSLKNILESLGVDLTPPTQDAEGNEVETDNQFFPIVIRMANRYESPETFVTIMQTALPSLQERANNAAPAQQILLQEIIEAIQLYIAE